MELKLSPQLPLLVVLNILFAFEVAKSHDTLCPITDNPFNIPFTVPREKLFDGRILDLGLMVLKFIDRRDVACKQNFDDVTVEAFKSKVNCKVKNGATVVCQVNPKCTAQRKTSFLRLRDATLKVLDEVVLKIMGIKFFNYFPHVKHVIFGPEPIANLTGLEIVTRAATGRTNIVNGFSISNDHQQHTRKAFHDEFTRTVRLYANLGAADEPTGLLADNVCEAVAKSGELNDCHDHFLTNLKLNHKLHPRDINFRIALNEALDLTVSYLTNRTRHFPGVNIPFIGDCIDKKALDIEDEYWNLFEKIQGMKDIRYP